MAKTKILLVEDNFVTSEEICDRLVHLGFSEIATAYSGAEAVTLAEELQPDLILMDIHLGAGIDGIEATERIQARRSVPVIYLTAYDNDATLTRTKITDHSAYLLKPVRERELHIAIEIALYKHQTEEKLRRSEQRFRAIFEQSAAGIVIALPDERIIDVNQKLCDMLGYSKEELIQLTVPYITLSEDQGHEMRQVQEVLAGNQDSFNLEKRYIHKDGHPVWGNLSSTVVRDEQGNIEYVIGVVVDITKKKQAEQALQESEELFRTAINTSPSCIFIKDLEGHYLLVNETIARLYGTTPAEMLGKTDVEFAMQHRLTQTEAEKFFVNDRQVIQTEKPKFILEEPFSLPDGSTRWFQTTKIPISLSGRTDCMLGIAVDITTRKQVEAALQQSEQVWRDSFNSLDDVMMILNPDHTIEKINRYGLELFDLPQEQVIGQKCYHLLHGVDQPQQDYPCKEALHSKQPISAERYRQAFGRYFSIKSAPILDEEGNIVKCVDLMRDITELKTVERELREANATKDKFFSIIVHDLKNPIIAFESATRMLVQYLQQNDDQESYNLSRELHLTSQRLSKFLENLLTWARSQQGAIPYRPDSLDVAMLVRYCMNLLQAQATPKQITFTCQIEEGMLVFADLSMFETIVRNLLSNAIKFTHRGGKVTISACEQGEMVAISVMDTGKGMSGDKRRKLFKFGEGNISSRGTEGEHGTGLGLILCQEFVERHGGQIWAESEEGKGSTFTFTLPKGMG